MSKDTMKYWSVLSACLLLLWTLTVFGAEDKIKIEVKKVGSDKFELICSDNGKTVQWKKNDVDVDDVDGKIQLEYKDEESGKYTCDVAGNSKEIYVKFRTCDNCIELDVPSVVGMAIGDLVATAVIGVAVYLIASQARSSLITSPQKKSSDRQHLVSNEVTSRGTNDHYQQLRHKGGQRETYDVISKR